MSHHRHFVQCWLSIENDDVIVAEMPLNLIANLQLEIGRFGVLSQVNSLACIADDIFRAGVLICAAIDQLLKIVNVEGGHDFRICEV